MKNSILTLSFFLFLLRTQAQIFSPIPTSGYNLDAVAENTTATSTTGGAIDGSNYVLYSAAYGAIFNANTGLPNNGIITSGTFSYQLQPYTQNNVLYLLAGQSGTITLNTPASYAGLSLLGFATEGNATFTVQLKFTDNTTTNFTSQSFPDWFGTNTAIHAGFDRATRSTGNIANASGNPKMYSTDLPLNCAERSKLVQSISIHNTGTNARVVLMAVSGANAPVFTATAQPVTCVGGKNGSASVAGLSGILPYTYTWSTVPPQNVAQVVGLPVGVYTYSAQDNQGCVVASTVAVTQVLSPEPPLALSSNVYTLCGGNTFTLGVSGASSYTWQGGSNGNSFSPPVVNPSVPTVLTYTVEGLTAVNCLRTGSVNITINPLPAASFISTLTPVCRNSAALSLQTLVQQSGGSFAGPGVASGSFVPTLSVGIYTITYTRTDNNNCSRTAMTSIQISSLSLPALSTPPPVCANAAVLQLTASPQGGTYTGPGVSATGLFNGSTLGAGTYTASYITVSGPCTTSASANIVVNAIPNSSITTNKKAFCKTEGALFLNAIPTGGTFSGPGMTGPSFSPSKANLGSHKIIYVYTDGNGCSDTSAINIAVNECAGIFEPGVTRAKLTAFPNPASGVFTIQADQKASIQIFNEVGQFIRLVELTEETGLTSEIIDLNPGIYFIATQGASLSPVKVIVLH